MNFKVKKPKPKPVMKMITPGRRAYGEDWQEVTIAVDDDELKVTESVPAEAPPQGRPIYVPAMGNLEVEAVNFLLEGAKKSQEYGKHPSTMPMHEFATWLNNQWMDFCEQKIRLFQGKTTLGAGGFYQREKPGAKK